MDAPNQHIRDITTEEFQQAVLQRSREVPVVVDFWAEWYGPCKVLSPLLESVTVAADGAFELVKVDVDANQELAGQFGVQGIPTVIAFRDGAPVERFTGAIGERDLMAWLDAVLPSELDVKVDEARDAALAGDPETAARLFGEVLESDAGHSEAGTGLAALLIAEGNTEEAFIVLGRLSPTSEVERLSAAARLTASRDDNVSDLEARLDADPADAAARLDLARGLAARAEFEPALDRLIALVREKGEQWDEARQGMLDIFGVLGDDHPLTATYRRQLANALF